jgi:arylsulfatase A-like enzyme
MNGAQTPHGSPRGERGWLATLRAAITAGAVTGLLFGLADGSTAACVGTASLGLGSLVACIAGSVALYSLLWIAVLVVAGIACQAWLARRAKSERYLFLLRIGLSLALFCEIYWWTRPYVFYGRSSVSPERLLASAAMLAAGIVAGIVAARVITRLPRAVQLAISVAVLLCWIGGGAYVVSQTSGASTKGAIDARNRDMPNVLLVVVDAMRRDVLSCYGNPRVKTPAIDALAADGVLFENAFTQAPFTWTSFGSLLTGKYPRRHGLVQMKPGARMSRENVTMAYHLKSAHKKDGTQLTDADYLGGTFHTGTLSTGSGLLRGFDMYFEAMAGHELVSLDEPWSVFRSDLLLYIFKSKIMQRFDSGLVASEARKWLDAHAGQRFVCMVHLYSTHTPYDPPAEFKRLYCDPSYSGRFKSFYAWDREGIEAGGYTPTPADVAEIRNLYYAGVAQADALIGDLARELDARGIRDQTLMIVTSDHGESLGEQDLWEHNHMVQTNLRVPLVMRWPNHLPSGKRVPALTDEIDVLPTICDLAGIDPPHPDASDAHASSADPEREKRAMVDGKSLVPLVRGESASVREYSFAENGLELAVQDANLKLIVRASALAESDWKSALSGSNAAKPRLFDLATDPAEDHNLIDARREDAERLVKALRAWDASMPTPRSEVEVSSRELEADKIRLNKLGYTGGVGSGMSDGHAHPAPADGTTPANDVKSPNTDVKSPSTDVKSPGSGVNSPGSDAKSPSSDTKSPGSGTNSPGSPHSGAKHDAAENSRRSEGAKTP